MRLTDAALATKTYREIQDTGARTGSVLIVPIGSTEQHGHHLPVATDSILVEAVAHAGADRVAETVPVLVTPVLWLGVSHHHTSLGGTITSTFETLRSVLRDVATTAATAGFDAVLFLNGHGGNEPLIAATVSTIGHEYPSMRVLGLTYFRLADTFIDDVRESDIGGMAHGGEFETSLMLHLCPEQVRRDDIMARSQEEPYDRATQDLFATGPLSVYRDFEAYSPSGAIGAPELATAEKGERIYDGLQDAFDTLLRDIHEESQHEE